MAILDPDGLFYGERLKRCSDLAQLFFPRFLLAANGFGRIQLDYASLMRGPLASLKRPPTRRDVLGLFREYQEKYLAFPYIANGEAWAQWDVAPRLLPRYQTAADRRSPAPPIADMKRWKDEYVAKKKASSVDLLDFQVIFTTSIPKSDPAKKADIDEVLEALDSTGTWETHIPENLPTGGGVYAVMLPEQLLYIGQSSAIRKRFQMHQIKCNRVNGLPFEGDPSLVIVRVLSVDDPTRRSDIERELIAKLNPPLNSHYTGTKPYSIESTISKIPEIPEIPETAPVGIGIGIGDGIGDGKDKTSAATKQPQVDERYTPFVELLDKYWKHKNPETPFTFAAPDGKNLKLLLKEQPGLTAETFHQCLIHRARSDVVHSELPRKWLLRILEYANGPLDRFSKPIESVRGAHPEASTGMADKTILAAFAAWTDIASDLNIAEAYPRGFTDGVLHVSIKRESQAQEIAELLRGRELPKFIADIDFVMEVGA